MAGVVAGSGNDDELETTVYIIAGVLGGVSGIIIICMVVMFAYMKNISQQLATVRNKLDNIPDSGLGEYLPRLETPAKPVFGGAPSIRGDDDLGMPRQNMGRNPAFNDGRNPMFNDGRNSTFNDGRNPAFNDGRGGIGKPGPQQQRPGAFKGHTGMNSTSPIGWDASGPGSNAGGWSGPGQQRPNRIGY